MGTIHTCAAQVAIFYSIAAVALATWLVEKNRFRRNCLWFWISSAAGVPVLMLIIWGDRYGIQMPIPVDKLLVNYTFFYLFMLLLCLLPFGGISLLLYSLFKQRKETGLYESSGQRDRFTLVFWLGIGASVLAWVVLLFLPRILL
ncbi:MAG: hypothetical protein K2X29_10270 [Candidatus Obscuribacterales bacterium]|nr:hypothetical protein [Candidatus Obscuribacterales bacterium]